MEKNRQNKKIHAEIVATEASENQMFLHIFFMPSFMQYQNVLIFTVRSTLSLVTYQTSLVQGDDTFAHLVYHFLTVGYDLSLIHIYRSIRHSGEDYKHLSAQILR